MQMSYPSLSGKMAAAAQGLRSLFVVEARRQTIALSLQFTTLLESPKEERPEATLPTGTRV
jgi:hypothetical protein